MQNKYDLIVVGGGFAGVAGERRTVSHGAGGVSAGQGEAGPGGGLPHAVPQHRL